MSRKRRSSKPAPAKGSKQARQSRRRWPTLAAIASVVGIIGGGGIIGLGGAVVHLVTRGTPTPTPTAVLTATPTAAPTGTFAGVCRQLGRDQKAWGHAFGELSTRIGRVRTGDDERNELIDALNAGEKPLRSTWEDLRALTSPPGLAETRRRVVRAWGQNVRLLRRVLTKLGDATTFGGLLAGEHLYVGAEAATEKHWDTVVTGLSKLAGEPCHLDLPMSPAAELYAPHMRSGNGEATTAQLRSIKLAQAVDPAQTFGPSITRPLIRPALTPTATPPTTPTSTPTASPTPTPTPSVTTMPTPSPTPTTDTSGAT